MKLQQHQPEPQIGKRATFLRNIKLITKRKDIHKALMGWSVVRLVCITQKGKQASCELCGTRFKFGALMRYDSAGVEITVGGVCVKTIQNAGFSASGQREQRLTNTWLLFTKNYEKERSILRGAWFTWIIANAPRRFASTVLDLNYFGATRTDQEMQQLIDYHDAHRLYPIDILIPEWRIFSKSGVKVPEYLTLKQARRILSSSSVLNNKDIIKALADRFRRKMILPFVKEDNSKILAWDSLCKSDKRVVTSLAYLSENNLINVKASLETLFPQADCVSSSPQFVWNHAVGLGFMEKVDNLENGRAYIELWSDRSIKYYDLHYFRSIHSDNASIVTKIELLTFGKQ